jgi:copper chaperone
MEHITLKVGGMSCMGCVASVKKLLEQLAGVAKVEVDLANGEADVDYDAMQCDPAQLRQAIVDGGYQAGD